MHPTMLIAHPYLSGEYLDTAPHSYTRQNSPKNPTHFHSKKKSKILKEIQKERKCQMSKIDVSLDAWQGECELWVCCAVRVFPACFTVRGSCGVGHFITQPAQRQKKNKQKKMQLKFGQCCLALIFRTVWWSAECNKTWPAACTSESLCLYKQGLQVATVFLPT